jgi:hypothetical protein
MMRHNDQFGVEIAVPTAAMPTMMLIIPLPEGYHQSPGTKPTYSYIGHNPQQTHYIHQRIVT